MYRPYVNGASQTGGSLTTDGWPPSTLVLLQNDVIFIEGDTTEYTSQTDGTSNASGQLTISISPALAASPDDNTPLLIPAPRSLSSNMRTQIANEIASIFHFIEFQFSGATRRYTTAPHDVSWNSLMWTGIGGALRFELVQESTDLSGQGVDVVVSGVDQTILNVLLTEKYIGRVCKVWMAHLYNNGTVVNDPLLIFFGRMNGGMTIDEKREEGRPGTVEIKARMMDRMGDMSQVRGMMTNVESHKKYFPNDEFFSYMTSLMGKKIKWAGI